MIKKCLMPVAGYGTRFLPATKAMPKEMLPVVDKPLVQYGVEEAVDAGIHNFCFITGRGKRAIADHFDLNYELEHQIKGTNKEELLDSVKKLIERNEFVFVRQNQMKGLGNAVLTGKNVIGQEPFAVLLADDLCLAIENNDNVLCQMINIYNQHQCCVIAVEEVPHSEIDKYGIVEGNLIEDGVYSVSNMIEKPQLGEISSNLAIIGRYILTPDIFDILGQIPEGKNGEVQLTDAIFEISKLNKVVAYKFHGKRFDCGSIHGYVEAINYVYNKVY